MNALENIVVTEINDVYSVYATKGRHIKVNNRQTYGLSFCVSGKITYNLNGKKHIENPNTAVILPINKTYALYNNEGGEFPLINFSCKEHLTDEIISIPLDNTSEYLKDYERLKKCFLLPSQRLKCIGIFYNILNRLNRENSNASPLIKPITGFILEHFRNSELNNTQIAESVNISEVYLRRIFLDKYGTTPKQYILELRTDYAKKLLISTNISITDLSAECGFASVYHFCRTFKEKTGLTPSKYRSKYRQMGI